MFRHSTCTLFRSAHTTPADIERGAQRLSAPERRDPAAYPSRCSSRVTTTQPLVAGLIRSRGYTLDTTPRPGRALKPASPPGRARRRIARSVLGPQPVSKPRTTAGTSGHRTFPETAARFAYRPLTSDGREGRRGVRVSQPDLPFGRRAPLGANRCNGEPVPAD